MVIVGSKNPSMNSVMTSQASDVNMGYNMHLLLQGYLATQRSLLMAKV